MQLQVSGLRYVYSQTDDAIASQLALNFSIPSGSRVAVFGPTGSGKSTTLALLAGLLKPTAGSIRYDGKEVNNQAERRQWRRQIGMSLQQPETQLFAATVWDEVQFAPLNYGMPFREARQLASQALAGVYLDPTRYGPLSPFALSGGEQRRVALASVMVMQPALLLLDEPLAGMDAQTAFEVWQGVEEYLSHHSCTCLVAAHDYERIWQWADYLLVLDKGRLLFNGFKADYRPLKYEEPGFSCQTQLGRLKGRLRASGWHLPHEESSPQSLAAALLASMELGKP